MNISARCEYGYLAVLELAGHLPADDPVTVETIAARRNIPEKFLVHVLLQLKRTGIVRSVRGSKGGYLLGRPPEAVSLLDIVEAIEGPVLKSSSAGAAGPASPDPVWAEAATAIGDVLSGMTIRDSLDKAVAGAMYYI